MPFFFFFFFFKEYTGFPFITECISLLNVFNVLYIKSLKWYFVCLSSQKLEKINRAREQGWRNVLSASGAGGEVKVGI